MMTQAQQDLFDLLRSPVKPIPSGLGYKGLELCGLLLQAGALARSMLYSPDL